ncbi:hypothetical protein [Nocardia sp. NPDC050413]|uniref:hypothetical protein n=1 Tax=Nocardia sp. NPDC050413 TaxID=3155784 RepID=UPI0033FA0DCF
MAGTRCPTGPLIVRVLEGHGVEEASQRYRARQCGYTGVFVLLGSGSVLMSLG